jgi:hypothetical protein
MGMVVVCIESGQRVVTIFSRAWKWCILINPVKYLHILGFGGNWGNVQF